MRHKRLSNSTLRFLLILGFALLQAPIAAASAPPGGSQTEPAAEAATLAGEFYFERTFGQTGNPYFADAAHLYNPEGVGVDVAGNLWVAEPLGGRLLKYSGSGAFLKSIGEAGKAWLADNSHISVPMDVTVAPDGSIWAVDNASHRVVKYNAAGAYQLQLGETWAGGNDNTHFSNPRSIAFDSSGKIYVSDTGNHRVQVFNSNGTYNTTIGVTAIPGSDNAHLSSPWRIAIDGSNNLYVVDLGNERVQVFNASHAWVATLGVTGAPGFDNSHFNNPRGVAVDAGKIYVADGGNHRVQIFNRASRAYQSTLGIGGGSGDYQFDWPGDVAVDSAGNIYVADELNARVQKFNSSLVYQRTFGTTGVPYLTDAKHFNMPNGVAINGQGDLGIVEDEGRGHRYIQLDATGSPQFTLGEPGVEGNDNEHFANPADVAFDANGNIYIADQWNHRVQIYDKDGNYLHTVGSGPGAGPTQLNSPAGVTVTGNGDIYVADYTNHRIQIFYNNGTHKATLGVTGVHGSDNGHFWRPSDVAVDAWGNIYVADTWNNRVQKFDHNRGYLMTIANFWGASGVSTDSAGNVYVADTWNNRVQVYNGAGNYLATIGGSFGGGANQLRYPARVAVDASGNVYIADKDNQRVQKYAPSKKVFLPVTVSGSP
jgi:streptogramin lyase